MKKLLFLIGVLSFISCSETNILPKENEPNPAEPTPVKLVKVIEYRVNGSVNVAAIRYVSPTEGTVLVNTTLPWVGQSKTNEDTFFLYLAAQDVGTGFVELNLHVQIFVDGKLFREALTTGFLPNATVSGTFVK